MQSEPSSESGPELMRVLLLPPTARDADAIRSLLAGAKISCVVCRDMAGLCDEVRNGAGAVLVSEESIIASSHELIRCVGEQPVWADLPILVLSRCGAESPRLSAILSALGNTSVLERPVRTTTLSSLVRSALRARERQYQVRDHLIQRERDSRMKDEFLATLSHELRTPLNAILGWVQILKTNPDDAADVKEGIEIIERNARAQTQIIEDLLDMSRIISGKVRLDVQQVDLESVVRSATQTVRPAADAKGVKINCVLDPHGHSIAGDPGRLQQVFWNLLTNAVKFTSKGGQVQVRLERIDSHLEVSVADTGEGIDPAFLPHVFDRFRQADASTTRHHGGLGLGLAIVKQLIELHGGSIRAKSPGPGQGSTFTVVLPVSIVHPEPQPVPVRRHPANMVPVAPDICVKIAGVKVLVVDDEPDARSMLQRVLQDCDAIVTTAASAIEALQRVKAEPPDIIISDIGMPAEDGYSLIRRVRALPASEGGATPAVALTAYARAEDRMKAVLAGFQHHVAKPVEPAELITLVASLTGRTPSIS